MKTCSPKIYIPLTSNEIKEYFSSYEDRKDTNICCLNFTDLKEDITKKLTIGDPITCQHCFSVLNNKSKIQKLSEESSKMEWKCEFCFKLNFLEIDENEFPQQVSTYFLIESYQLKSPLEKKPNKEEDEAEINPHFQDDSNIIFCVDESGSMSSSHGNKRISRIDCVKSAIKTLITKFKTTRPNKKIGIVTFESVISVIGDGQIKEKKYNGSNASEIFTDFDECYKTGESLSKIYFDVPLFQSYEVLMEKIEQLCPKGGTSLGPGLLLSVGIASKQENASRIIICTDGAANNGMGSFSDSREIYTSFYNRVKEICCLNGISISIISIIGQDCKLDVLGELADNTNGTIHRVNPDCLNEVVHEAVQEEIIASQIEIKVFFNKFLDMRNEKEWDFTKKENYYSKIIPNAKVSTEISFEFDLKQDLDNPNSLMELVENNTLLPIQIQTTFKNKKGKFTKIQTTYLEVCNNLEKVRGEGSLSVFRPHINEKVIKKSFLNKKKAIFDSGEFFKLSSNIGTLHSYEANNIEREKIKESTEKFQDIILGKKCFNSSNIEEIKDDDLKNSSNIPKRKSLLLAKKKPVFDSGVFYQNNSLNNKEYKNEKYEEIQNCINNKLSIVVEKETGEFEISDEQAFELFELKKKKN